jgi:hypothetical protein
VLALSTRKALQVVDIGAGPHDHLEGRNHLVAGSTESRAPEQSVGGRRAAVSGRALHSAQRDTHLR